MKYDPRFYLLHILDAIAHIEAYLQGITEQDFFKRRLVQDGVIHQLEMIGEAVKRLPSDLKEKYPHVPWQDAAGMQDKLIQDSFGVDIDTVWLTTQDDLPRLKQEIQHIVDELLKPS